ncbi:MAG: hypothetical protein LH470_07100 [Lysobacter sp.]|nr:hypothetical protein [Lysobacter sp.]
MNHDSMTHDGMNHDNRTPDDTLPDALRWSLRGLRRDVVPQHDLWSGIAARITETPAAATYTGARYRRRWNGAVPLAIAATVVFAVGIAWQLRSLPPDAGMSPASNLAREAAAMTREYDAAMSELATGNRVDLPALRVLDRSAAAIRTAMTRDPDARFLLDRLRHTYERRLALTQRVALI